MAYDDVTNFQNPTGIRWSGDTGIVEYNRQKHVVFYRKPHHNPQKSMDAGRPISDDVIYVKIQEPGDRTTVIDRPVKEADKQAYVGQWRQFLENQEQVPEGTPIELYRPYQPSIAANLRGAGVHTIEQCANLSGHAIDSIGMGAQKWSNECKEYLELANRGVGAAKFTKVMEEKDSEIRVLKQQMTMLKAEVERLSAAGNAEQIVQLQKMFMQMQGRPQYVASPPLQPNAPVDPSMAMINATHPTQEIAKRRGRPPKVQIEQGVPLPRRK